MSPRAAPLPATNTAERHNAPPDAPPAQGTSSRPRRLSLSGRLGALLALLITLLVVEAVVVLGPLRHGQRDPDAVLSRGIEHSLQARKMQTEFERQGQEWDNILLRSSAVGALPAYVQRYRDRSAAVTALADTLQAQVDDPTAAYLIVAFRNEYQLVNEANDEALQAFFATGGLNPRGPEAATAEGDRGPSNRLAAVVERLDAVTTAARATQQDAVARQHLLLLLLGLLIVGVTLGTVAVVVGGIIRPIRRIAREADRSVREILPATIAQVRALPADAVPPSPIPLHVGTGDELEELGRALSATQAVAVDLAVQERRAVRDSAQTLINLGRRNQNLVEHTLARIGSLKAGRHDAAVAADVARLERTLFRIRRSAESMLVLGSAPSPTRIRTRPVPVAEIVRTALAEVEDSERVDLHHVEEAAVVGTAVPDLTHLVSELLENALHFSPPDVRVTVVGRFSSSGRYGLHVVDQGIGMTNHELAQANAHILEAAQGSLPDTHLLGLHVVGRIAARIAVQVALHPSTGRGVTAHVALPPAIVIDIECTPTDHDTWTPPRGSRRGSTATAAAAGAARHAPDGPHASGSSDTGTQHDGTITTATPPSGEPTAGVRDDSGGTGANDRPDW